MSLPANWNSGGSAEIAGHERPSIRDLLHPLSGFSSLTSLKAITDTAARLDGMPAFVDGKPWFWNASSTLTADNQLVAIPDDSPTAGRWLRAPGSALFVLPITYATADAAVLLTVPTGCFMYLHELYWSVSTDFTGGSSSAIGVSSNKTNFTTKGDLLGGASGNVAATLVTSTTPILGTIGAGFDTLAKRRVVFGPGETIRFDRITSVFTAGVGAVNVIATVLRNAGA